MELFFNDVSLHGQFQDVQGFVGALDTLMQMRQVAKSYGREIYCNRNCLQAMVTQQLSVPQVVGGIEKNKARALMLWFGQSGPYWEDVRQHSEDEYLECQDEVVTDTAVGECAYLKFSQRQAQLASFSPSLWSAPLLEVIWRREGQDDSRENVVNHCSVASLDSELQRADPPIESWEQLRRSCLRRFDNLHFSDDAFEPLFGRPFVLAAARSFIDLLSVLSRFKATHRLGAGRTQEGDELYQTYFTGPRAWFSDSSDREKIDFEHEMTFPHPEIDRDLIFAPFHGKVQTPQMRIHFSWPVTASSPLYVLYVGDKITKY